MQIEPDSPAARASLLPGDVVIGLDGVEINGVDDLIRALDHSRIDRTLSMDILRLGRLRAIEIHRSGGSRRSNERYSIRVRAAPSSLVGEGGAIERSEMKPGEGFYPRVHLWR